MSLRETSVETAGHSQRSPLHAGCDKGFTLLEVLVAVAIMAIAVTIVLQLFSTNLRAIAASEEYVLATAKANAAMREVLDNDKLEEKSSTDRTNDGYRIDTLIAETLQERTDNLQVKVLEITVTTTWTSGSREKSITLRTLRTVEKKI